MVHNEDSNGTDLHDNHSQMEEDHSPSVSSAGMCAPIYDDDGICCYLWTSISIIICFKFMICTLKQCILSAFDDVKHGKTPFFLQVFQNVVVNFIS